ncbi:hypothetical protein EV421DRAFT_1508761 [Armillaria borealis]|uniref:Uncharacterized protein n=1 Tax=Armillaria borealis TaxID=47425 RepID=A0AA39MFC9_9AGAR|nr:hypothetical protein EV421DRAFT_1508761 [Armillaria borealis]
MERNNGDQDFLPMFVGDSWQRENTQISTYWLKSCQHPRLIERPGPPEQWLLVIQHSPAISQPSGMPVVLPVIAHPIIFAPQVTIPYISSRQSQRDGYTAAENIMLFYPAIPSLLATHNEYDVASQRTQGLRILHAEDKSSSSHRFLLAQA